MIHTEIKYQDYILYSGYDRRWLFVGSLFKKLEVPSQKGVGTKYKHPSSPKFLFFSGTGEPQVPTPHLTNFFLDFKIFWDLKSVCQNNLGFWIRDPSKSPPQAHLSLRLFIIVCREILELFIGINLSFAIICPDNKSIKIFKKIRRIVVDIEYINENFGFHHMQAVGNGNV